LEKIATEGNIEDQDVDLEVHEGPGKSRQRAREGEVDSDGVVHRAADG
jgi:hypothetical protein